MFYTNKSNKTAAYCIQPGVLLTMFSLSALNVTDRFMQAVYSGIDAISSIKEEVRYV
ncbi:hypothetical protein [Brenneria alni]|uniref:hypothetical protein n=1 Tax=Brenneria alni TaxID=71656 RepID=UPI001475FC80|nr:hypothetical protein [Brenneria alni]